MRSLMTLALLAAACSSPAAEAVDGQVSPDLGASKPSLPNLPRAPKLAWWGCIKCGREYPGHVKYCKGLGHHKKLAMIQRAPDKEG